MILLIYIIEITISIDYRYAQVSFSYELVEMLHIMNWMTKTFE